MAWIRTQRQDAIHNVNSVWVHGDRMKGETFPDEGGGWILGDFIDEESAIAELDGVERWLEAGGNGVYCIK